MGRVKMGVELENKWVWGLSSFSKHRAAQLRQGPRKDAKDF